MEKNNDLPVNFIGILAEILGTSRIEGSQLEATLHKDSIYDVEMDYDLLDDMVVYKKTYEEVIKEVEKIADPGIPFISLHGDSASHFGEKNYNSPK